MEFKEHLKKYLSNEEIDSLVNSFNDEEQKGLYLNLNKLSHEDLLKEFPSLEKHPDVSNGYLFFKSEKPLGSHLFFDLGAYYIQDPSAMNVTNLLPLEKGELILDMCAAPGGKTNVLSLRLGDDGEIISNDISSSRCQTLLQNVERMGLDNVIVTNLDFERCYKNYHGLFTSIVLDAPCSGSGMFRKSSLMKDDWTYEKVLKYQSEQKKLIDICSYMLMDGGYLMYSTCSYSYEEDEEIVKYALDNYDFELVDLPTLSGGLRGRPYKETIHLFPSNYKGEGQYIALLRKRGERNLYRLKETTFTRKSVNKGNKPIISTFRLNMEVPTSLLEKALRPGLFISTSYLDGSNLTYEHHYAKSLKKDDPRLVNISLEDTKKIIMGESINLDLPDGDYFLSYQNMPIGVIKKRNGLVKNHYPKGIRKRF